jgi:hypothetical protein
MHLLRLFTSQHGWNTQVKHVRGIPKLARCAEQECGPADLYHLGRILPQFHFFICGFQAQPVYSVPILILKNVGDIGKPGSYRELIAVQIHRRAEEGDFRFF